MHKTVNLVGYLFWWLQMKTTIWDYNASYTICRQAKEHMGKPEGLLLPLAAPEELWQTLSLDFVVELLPSQGFMSILVVVDTLQNVPF